MAVANLTGVPEFQDGDFQRLYEDLNRTDFGAAYGHGEDGGVGVDEGDLVANALANATTLLVENVTSLLLANESLETTTESIYFKQPHSDPELARCAKIVLKSDIRVRNNPFLVFDS